MQMVKCTKRQIRQLKTALHWKIPEAQRQRIQMVLLREGGMAQPAIAAAMGVSLSTVKRDAAYHTPGWFHAWCEANVFESGRDGKPGLWISRRTVRQPSVAQTLLAACRESMLTAVGPFL